MTDTIPVRVDERFDEAQLAYYLRDKLEGAHEPLRVEQFGGGAANLTYLLDYGSHHYVLRRPPLGPVAPSSHDMSREYRVLSVLHQTFPLAPRAFLYCDEHAIIGSPFIVMERREGIVVRRSIPPEFADIPDAPQRMSAVLVDALAAFHAVDYHTLGLETLGKPAGFVERQIEGWYGRWHEARTGVVPEMEVVYEWLHENVPPPNPRLWFTTIISWIMSCWPRTIPARWSPSSTGICVRWATRWLIWGRC